jgi:acyl-CoA thioesterase FadM
VLTKWLIYREYAVSPADLDASGEVLPAVVAGWLDDVRTDYLARCPLLTSLGTVDVRTVGPARVVDALDGVAVTATAAEVQPSAVTLSLRIRTADRTFDARSVVRVLDGDGQAVEFGKGVRDELIALEHSATHYN